MLTFALDFGLIMDHHHLQNMKHVFGGDLQTSRSNKGSLQEHALEIENLKDKGSRTCKICYGSSTGV